MSGNSPKPSQPAGLRKVKPKAPPPPPPVPPPSTTPSGIAAAGSTSGTPTSNPSTAVTNITTSSTPVTTSSETISTQLPQGVTVTGTENAGQSAPVVAVSPTSPVTQLTKGLEQVLSQGVSKPLAPSLPITVPQAIVQAVVQAAKIVTQSTTTATVPLTPASPEITAVEEPKTVPLPTSSETTKAEGQSVVSAGPREQVSQEAKADPVPVAITATATQPHPQPLPPVTVKPAGTGSTSTTVAATGQTLSQTTTSSQPQTPPVLSPPQPPTKPTPVVPVAIVSPQPQPTPPTPQPSQEDKNPPSISVPQKEPAKPISTASTQTPTPPISISGGVAPQGPSKPMTSTLSPKPQTRQNLKGLEDGVWYKIRNVGDNSVVQLDSNKFICMEENEEKRDSQLFRAVQQSNGAYRIMTKMQSSAETFQVWDYLPHRGLLIQKKQADNDKFNQNWKSEPVPGYNSLYLIQSGPDPESQYCLKNVGLGQQIKLLEKNAATIQDKFTHWYLEVQEIQ